MTTKTKKPYKRKTKKQLEAEAHRRFVKATLKAQADFRVDEIARHMDEIAEYLEEQGGQVTEEMEYARRGYRRNRQKRL